MPSTNDVLDENEKRAIHSNGQDWIISWHAPPVPPLGIPHGAAGICVTGDGNIVIISPDGTK